MIKRHAVAALFTMLAVLAFACGGDDDAAGATPAGGATESDPVATATANELVPAPNGVPPLVYDALVTRDAAALAGLTYYEEVACADVVSPEAPLCRPGEEAGTPVAVFRRDVCDPEWIRPEEVSGTYSGALAGGDVTLVAAYAPTAAAFDVDRTIAAALVVRVGDDAASGFVVGIDDGGRIAVLEGACGDVAALYAEERVARFIVEP